MKLTSIIQYFLPQHILSRLAGKIFASRHVWFKNACIRRFIATYHVNMHEALSENINDYPCFHDFFIRPLKPGLRAFPTDPHAIASPVDGCISQIGRLAGNQIIQAKGKNFSVNGLLSHDECAREFSDGAFTTIYLAPKDYHRVHMPITGTLKRMIFIPGKLFSVNPQTVADVDNIFARNERVVCLFETAIGPCAVILVGAMIVSSISIIGHGVVKSSDCHQPTVWDYSSSGKDALTLQRGEELGYFSAGSTVILLFAKDRMQWNDNCVAGDAVKLGEVLGETN